MSFFPLSLVCRLVVGLCFCVVCGASLGCGSPAGEPLAVVAGRVTIDGKPLTTGTVSFRPDAARGNGSQHHPIGTLDAQGNYTLVTVGQKGAPLGWYKVLVFADENSKPGRAAHPVMPRWLVHPKYTTEKTTPLAVEVVSSPQPGRYNFQVSK
jgi:hypothetical protein